MISVTPLFRLFKGFWDGAISLIFFTEINF